MGNVRTYANNRDYELQGEQGKRRWRRKSFPVKAHSSHIHDNPYEEIENNLEQNNGIDTRNESFENLYNELEQLIATDNTRSPEENYAIYQDIHERTCNEITDYVDEYGLDFPENFPFFGNIKETCRTGKPKELLDALQDAVNEELDGYPINYTIDGKLEDWDDEKEYTGSLIASIEFTGVIGNNEDSIGENTEHINRILDIVRPNQAFSHGDKRTKVFAYIKDDSAPEGVAYYLAEHGGYKKDPTGEYAHRKAQGFIVYRKEDGDRHQEGSGNLIHPIETYGSYHDAIQTLSYIDPYQSEIDYGLPTYNNLSLSLEDDENNPNIDPVLGIDKTNIERGIISTEDELKRIYLYDENDHINVNEFNRENALINFMTDDSNIVDTKLSAAEKLMNTHVMSFVNEILDNSEQEVKDMRKDFSQEFKKKPIRSTVKLVSTLTNTKSFFEKVGNFLKNRNP